MSVETPQQTVLPKISKDVDFLSADDAVKVANLFNHGNVLTKSETLKEVKAWYQSRMEMLEINLTISPNNTDSVRKCDLMFTDCGAGNVDANAKVTISQPPK